MSILIRGMEMPKNCGECPFIFTSWGIEYYCHLAESSTSAEYVGREKMTNCPLIELPPHGRLIDADAVNKAMDERIEKLKDDKSIYEASCVSTALDMFAPTVIEAEER